MSKLRKGKHYIFHMIYTCTCYYCTYTELCSGLIWIFIKNDVNFTVNYTKNPGHIMDHLQIIYMYGPNIHIKIIQCHVEPHEYMYMPYIVWLVTGLRVLG